MLACGETLADRELKRGLQARGQHVIHRDILPQEQTKKITWINEESLP